MMCLTVDDVYRLCNDHQWFTCGTVEQYDKMFDFVRKYEIKSSDDMMLWTLARLIWICSDKEFQEIYDVLNSFVREKVLNELSKTS